MIVPVKKIKLAVLNEYRDRLIQNLQKHGVIMLIPQEEQESTAADDDLLKRTEQTLEFIKEYRSKDEPAPAGLSLEYEEFMRFDEKRENLLSEIEFCREEIIRLENEIKSIVDLIAYYEPWQGLSVGSGSLGSGKYSMAKTGLVSPYQQKQFSAIMAAYGGDYEFYGPAPGGIAVALVYYRADEALILAELKTAGFQEVNLPMDSRPPAVIINESDKRLSALKKELAGINARLEEYSFSEKELMLLRDQLDTTRAFKNAPVAALPRTVYLEGWVRESEVSVLEEAVKDVTDIFALDICDPDEGEIPPTVMENSKFVEPFETITDMFAVPDPYEVDPNPALSVWFIFLFGMMMGDFGYGLIMTLGTYFYLRQNEAKGKDLRLIKIFLYSGLATMLWGMAYGSYFGFTLKPNLIEPMDDPLKMLMVSLAVGLMHIITGILIKAYGNIRKKRYFSAVFDQFSWIFILIGAGMFFLPGMSSTGYAFAITGGVLILAFGGRNYKNIFGKIFGGLSGLYNITSFLSDVLSYSRILALALSTATIGWVMNMLAGMLAGSVFGYFLAGIVFIIGHTFNIVMGLLSAYVHDSRLQYIEFFNQFYQGGGYAFQPLSLKLKYTKNIKIANTQEV